MENLATIVNVLMAVTIAAKLSILDNCRVLAALLRLRRKSKEKNNF